MSRNTSDLIESYLKDILENSEIIEIRRAEMAQLFNCVPSQINYVINTRFTFQRGYLVESKRGGGGYIRISKVKISDQHYFLKQLMESFGSEISETNAFGIIQKSKNVLGISQIENRLRSRILHGFLERLSYEKKE